MLPLTAAEVKELRMRENKVKIKKDFIDEKCNTLQAEIPGYKNAYKMSNNEIHFTIKESQDWKKQTNEIVGLHQRYLEECFFDNATTSQRYSLLPPSP